jgi:thiol-disulfide isomerase/thioredoxin
MAIEVGANVPQCNLVDLSNNTPISLSKTGNVVYVDFWASWCAPCAKSMPFLNELHEQFSSKGLEIVGIDVDDDKADGLKFLEKVPVVFSTVTNPDAQCAAAFGVQTMPSSYLIDRKGKLRYIELGFFSENKNDIRQKVEKLLAE